MTLSSNRTLSVDCRGIGHDAFVVGDEVALVLDPTKTLVLAS